MAFITGVCIGMFIGVAIGAVVIATLRGGQNDLARYENDLVANRPVSRAAVDHEKTHLN